MRDLRVHTPPSLWSKVVELDAGWESPCWWWTGAPHKGRPYWSEPHPPRHIGSGLFLRRRRSRSRIAYRATYERMVGIIPRGMTLDHLCGHPMCVNPAHLQVEPIEENARRGGGRRRFGDRAPVVLPATFQQTLPIGGCGGEP